MGILALAAIPLLELVNNSIRGSASLEQRFLARTVAENILVEQLTESSLPNEKVAIETGVSKQLGRQFQWVVTISPVQETEPQLVLVEVRLENNPQLLAKLTGVRLPVLPSIENQQAGEQLDELRPPGGEDQ